jgi:hypothetical protein
MSISIDIATRETNIEKARGTPYLRRGIYNPLRGETNKVNFNFFKCRMAIYITKMTFTKVHDHIAILAVFEYSKTGSMPMDIISEEKIILKLLRASNDFLELRKASYIGRRHPINISTVRGVIKSVKSVLRHCFRIELPQKKKIKTMLDANIKHVLMEART